MDIEMNEHDRVLMALTFRQYTAYQAPVAGPLDAHGQRIHGPMPWFGSRTLYVIQVRYADSGEWSAPVIGGRIFTDREQAQREAAVYYEAVTRDLPDHYSGVRIVEVAVSTTYDINTHEVVTDD